MLDIIHCILKKLHPFNFLIIFGKNLLYAEPYLLVIGSSNVLLLRTSLNVADVAENTWCSTLKITFLAKIYINSNVMVLKKLVNFLMKVGMLMV